MSLQQIFYEKYNSDTLADFVKLCAAVLHGFTREIGGVYSFQSSGTSFLCDARFSIATESCKTTRFSPN
jgi:hypothetical protein